MERPSLKSATSQIVEYIEYLEEKLTGYEESNLVGLYKDINDKLVPLREAIRTVQIDLKGDDKVFERFMKVMVESRGIAENMDFLEKKLGINQGDDAKRIRNKFKNPLEQMVKDGKKEKAQQDSN